nr:hypothetical protein [Prevotella sp.]
IVTYSTDKRIAANLETITAERALQIIEMNKKGEKPESLSDENTQKGPERPADLLTGDINRFDKSKKKKKKNKQSSPKQAATQQNQQSGGEKQAGDKPKIDKARGERPKNDKPKGERPRGDRQQQRKKGPKPSSNPQNPQQPSNA